jgi:hypothetical protein
VWTLQLYQGISAVSRSGARGTAGGEKKRGSVISVNVARLSFPSAEKKRWWLRYGGEQEEAVTMKTARVYVLRVYETKSAKTKEGHLQMPPCKTNKPKKNNNSSKKKKQK